MTPSDERSTAVTRSDKPQAVRASSARHMPWKRTLNVGSIFRRFCMCEAPCPRRDPIAVRKCLGELRRVRVADFCGNLANRQVRAVHEHEHLHGLQVEQSPPLAVCLQRFQVKADMRKHRIGMHHQRNAAASGKSSEPGKVEPEGVLSHAVFDSDRVKADSHPVALSRCPRREHNVLRGCHQHISRPEVRCLPVRHIEDRRPRAKE